MSTAALREAERTVRNTYLLNPLPFSFGTSTFNFLSATGTEGAPQAGRLDDRIEVDAVEADTNVPNAARAWARSVGLVTLEKLVSGDLDAAALETQEFVATTIGGSEARLCEDERFRDQRVGGFATCFLVSAQHVLTARHVVFDEHNELREDLRFVFGYHGDITSDAPVALARDQLYGASDIHKGSSLHAKDDWAIIKLDRPVEREDTTPLRLADDPLTDDPIKLGLIGHPSGLPMKVAFNPLPQVVVHEQTLFVASLDAFQGNSGSPVLDEQGTVHGMLIRGTPHYVWNNNKRCILVRGLSRLPSEKILSAAALREALHSSAGQ